MKLSEKVTQMIEANEITEGEAVVLLPALEHLSSYMGEFDEIFGGFSDLELTDLGVANNQARGWLSSLIKKGLLQVNNQDVNGKYHQFIYLTKTSYSLLQEFTLE